MKNKIMNIVLIPIFVAIIASIVGFLFQYYVENTDEYEKHFSEVSAEIANIKEDVQLRIGAIDSLLSQSCIDVEKRYNNYYWIVSSPSKMKDYKMPFFFIKKYNNSSLYDLIKKHIELNDEICNNINNNGLYNKIKRYFGLNKMKDKVFDDSGAQKALSQSFELLQFSPQKIELLANSEHNKNLKNKDLIEKTKNLIFKKTGESISSKEAMDILLNITKRNIITTFIDKMYPKVRRSFSYFVDFNKMEAMSELIKDSGIDDKSIPNIDSQYPWYGICGK